MEASDLAVVARVKAGDHDAFRHLVERHSRSVFRLAYRLTGHEQDAEDVVQETFLRAFREIRRFEELNAGYFKALGIPLKRGRCFLPEEDREGSRRLLVHRFFQLPLYSVRVLSPGAPVASSRGHAHPLRSSLLQQRQKTLEKAPGL